MLDYSLKFCQLEIHVNFIKLLSFSCHNCYWKLNDFAQLVLSLILNQFFGVDIYLLSFERQFPLLFIIFCQLGSKLDLYFFEWILFFLAIDWLLSPIHYFIRKFFWLVIFCHFNQQFLMTNSASQNEFRYPRIISCQVD